MLLYHGTSSERANKIRETGLMPRGNESGNWFTPGKVLSHKRFVYLSKNYCLFHATRTAIIDNSPELAMISINLNVLDKRKLYPDEYFLGLEIGNNWAISQENMKQAKRIMYSSRNRWQESLEKVGNVCHLGGIDPSSLSIEFIPKKESLFYRRAIACTNLTKLEAIDWMTDNPPETVNFILKSSLQWTVNRETDDMSYDRKVFAK